MIYLFGILSVIATFLLAVCLWSARKLSIKRCGYLLVAMFAFPFIATEATQYYWYSRALPAKIAITYPVSTYDETGFREGCGTVVFKLSSDTLKMIDKEGIRFFDGATEGRGHPGEPYYRYAEWSRTPVPPSWTREGSWMMCSGLSREQHSNIVSAATSGGAYYTTKPEAQLVLIPSLGYVVFSFFG